MCWVLRQHGVTDSKDMRREKEDFLGTISLCHKTTNRWEAQKFTKKDSYKSRQITTGLNTPPCHKCDNTWYLHVGQQIRRDPPHNKVCKAIQYPSSDYKLFVTVQRDQALMFWNFPELVCNIVIETRQGAHADGNVINRFFVLDWLLASCLHFYQI